LRRRVEIVFEVLKNAQSNYFENHFKSKDSCKDIVANVLDFGQLLRLIIVQRAQGNGVENNEELNEILKPFILHYALHNAVRFSVNDRAFSHLVEAGHNTVHALVTEVILVHDF